jgi:phosphoribosylformylglycinamidine synthase
MGLPVTGGNVSFYNQTGAVAILPTPVIGVLGVIQDVRTRTKMGIPSEGLQLIQIGNTDDNFSGSEWAYLHGQMGDHAPTPDVGTEVRLIQLLLEAQPLFESAHDLSNGGLAAALTEATLRNNIGATIGLPGEFIPGGVAAALFAETPGRVLVAVNPINLAALEALASKYEIPLHTLGSSGGDSLLINDASISLTELRSAHTETFPKLFG